MKKRIIFILLCSFIVAAGCKEEFFAINEDPNGPTRTTPNLMLPAVIQQAAVLQGVAALATSTLTEQLATQRVNRPNVDNWVDLSSVNYSFQNNYWLVGSNNESMMRWAAEEGSWHHVGAGKVIKALTYGITTDLFGPIYYDQAIDPNYTQPRFDDQEYVYGRLLGLLDEAVAEFDKTEVFRPLSQGDILYNGDLSKWKKLARGIKARLLNHLSKKPAYNPREILSLVEQSFSSPADNAALPFADALGKANPWGPLGDVPSSSKTWDKFFVDYLKGVGLGGVEDPRLPLVVNPGKDGVYRGVVNGITKDGLPADAVGPLSGKAYTSNTSAYPLLTFEELKFIEAEAALRAGDRSRAYSAYRAGIRANLERVGVAGDEATRYLESTAVAPDASALTMSQVMTQKYIALFLNPEVWTDMRRFDYSSGIYPGLWQPAGANPALGGQWIRRLPPFSTEIDFNRAEVTRIGGLDADYTARPLWWDQP